MFTVYIVAYIILYFDLRDYYRFFIVLILPGYLIGSEQSGRQRLQAVVGVLW
jgi:hypothetical protein